MHDAPLAVVLPLLAVQNRNPLGALLPFLIIGAAFYLLVLRPQPVGAVGQHDRRDA